MTLLRPTSILRLLVSASLAATALARADEDTSSASVQLSAPTKPAILRIDVPWADIHVTGIDTNTVTVESTVAHQESKPAHPGGLRRLDDDVTFELAEHDNVVVLRLAGDNSGSSHDAEFKIAVPRAIALDVRTDSGGDLKVENVDGDIEINNMNGLVRLDGITGSAVINTMNGEVRAAYAKVPTKLISITSMNGEVDLRVPPETKANVRLRTHNGSILTDFSEDVLKTKSEAKGGSYRYRDSDAARMGADAARAAADSVRAAVRMAQDVAMEVQRAVQEESDDDAPAPTPSADAPPVPPVAPVPPADAPPAPDAPAKAPRPPRAPHAARAPRAPHAAYAPMAPITGGKLVTGTLNGGGVDIKISTMNGEIKLRQAEPATSSPTAPKK